MPRQRIGLVGFIYILTACASHIPAPETTPSSSGSTLAGTATPTFLSRGPWIFSTQEEPHKYQSTSHTIIHELLAPILHIDTVSLGTSFVINLSRPRGLATIFGYINSVTIRSTVRFSTENSKLALPIGFTGTVTAGELTLNLSDNQLECVSPASSILGEVRPVIVTYPSPLFPASAWTDSISATACSGPGIPTTIKSVRSYRVTGEATHASIHTLVIERTESTRFSGSGVQGHHQVQIEGFGTGSSRIYLDINTGTVTATETFEKVNLMVKSSGQVRHYIQEVTQKVELALSQPDGEA